MHEFTPHDILLLLAGCKIFVAHRAVTVLNYIMMAIVLICYTAAFVAGFEQVRTNNRFTILTIIERNVRAFSGIVFMIVIKRNQSVIRELIQRMLPALNSEQRSQLKWHAIKCLILVLLTIAQEFASTTWHLATCCKAPLTTKHILEDYAKSYDYVNSWFLGGRGMFAFFVKVVQFTDDNYFKELNEKGLQSMESSPSSRLALDRRAIMKTRHALLSSMSLMPCLWFVHLFVKSSAAAIEVAERFDKTSDKIWRLAPLAYMIFALLYLVWLCDLTTERLRDRVSETIEGILQNDQSERMQVFVSELRDNANQEISSWNTFDINRKFTLAFISSLITFTVLFVQLTYNLVGGKS